MTLQEFFSKPERWTQRTYARHKNIPGTVTIRQLRIFGLRKRSDFLEHGCCCLIGAVQFCYAGHPGRLDSVEKILLATFEKFHPDYLGTLEQFNDEPTTTFAIIQELVKEANV